MTSPPARFEPKVPRRGLLALVGVGLASSAIPTWAGSAVPDPLAERLASILTHRRSAQVIGRLYLTERQDEADSAHLLAALRGDLGLVSDAASGLSTSQLRGRVKRATHDDLRAGRTLAPGGHSMAVTELRLCALATLIA